MGVGVGVGVVDVDEVLLAVESRSAIDETGKRRGHVDIEAVSERKDPPETLRELVAQLIAISACRGPSGHSPP